VEYTPHDDDVTYGGCKKLFLKGEKICYKMVLKSLYLSRVNRVKLRLKVRIYTDEKLTFQQITLYNSNAKEGQKFDGGLNNEKLV